MPQLIKGIYDVGFWDNPSSVSLWKSAAQVQHHKFMYTLAQEEVLVYQKHGSSFNPMFVVIFFFRVPSFCQATE